MIASPAEIASLANMATCCCHCMVCNDRDVCNAYNFVVASTGSQRLQGLRAAYMRWYITRHNCAQLFRRISKSAKETIYGGSYIDQIPATLNGILPSRDPSS